MNITKRSPFSGEDNTLDLDVTQDQLDRWKGGELIQNVMPHLTPDEREFCISGIMPGGEWDQMFSSADEPDDHSPE